MQCKTDNSKSQFTSIPINIPIPAVPDFDSTIIVFDSTIILNSTYKFLLKTNDTFYISNTKSNYLQKFRLDDWGTGGLNDFRYALSSNTPLVENLFLFEKSTKSFKPVKGFEDFPDPKPVTGTKYYYSYHKSGCADLDWDSDLFYIENYQAIRIGNISGIGCSDEKQGAYIYKVSGKKKVLLQKYSIEEPEDYGNSKWDFIREYWSKNYSKNSFADKQIVYAKSISH
jgi:hypothetical protein